MQLSAVKKCESHFSTDKIGAVRIEVVKSRMQFLDSRKCKGFCYSVTNCKTEHLESELRVQFLKTLNEVWLILGLASMLPAIKAGHEDHH